MSDKTRAIVAKAILDHRYPEGASDGYDGVPPRVVEEINELAGAVSAALPDNAGTDFIRLMETWTESQTNLTAALLDMAICVMLTKMRAIQDPLTPDGSMSVTITSVELRAIAEQYHWERTEEPGSWTIKLQKISEMSSDEA